MLNVENVRKVIDAIKGEALTRGIGFNMNNYVRETAFCNNDMRASEQPCKTVACIAGHAHLIKTGEDPVRLSGEIWRNFSAQSNKIFGSARDWLGLTPDQADLLFFGENDEGDATIDLEVITAEDAIETLEHLIKTGKVEWFI